jgi:phenylacetate-CoA ligase
MNVYSSDLYTNSPMFLQNAVVSLKGLSSLLVRRNRRFNAYFSDARKRESWTPQRIKDFQCLELIRLIKHAVVNVPFYQKLFHDLGLSENSIRTPEDLKKLPYLEKETVRKEPLRFVASDSRMSRILKGYTSGTSGSPVRLFRSLDSILLEHSFLWRQFQWAGCRLDDRIAVLRGDMVVPAFQCTPPFWRWNLAEHLLLLSSYHLSDENIPYYLDALSGFRPTLIYAYPSAVYLLAEYILRRGATYPLECIRGVVTSSETLFRYQQDAIEEGLGCKVFDWYGLAERVAFIATCRYGNHHVFEDYGVSEFLPVQENRFELVGTGFINHAMPLVRYRTGDIVELDENQPCPCGSSFLKVKSIEGRMDDMVRLRNGKTIGRLDLVFKGLVGIKEAQIIQASYDEFRILAVVDGENVGASLNKLRDNFLFRVGTQVRLKIEVVASIPRTATGKFKAVISDAK